MGEREKSDGNEVNRGHFIDLEASLQPIWVALTLHWDQKLPLILASYSLSIMLNSLEKLMIM